MQPSSFCWWFVHIWTKIFWNHFLDLEICRRRLFSDASKSHFFWFILFFPTKKNRPTNTRCQFYFGWSRWWLLHWKCHGRTGLPWRVFLRHACAETLSLSQRCAQKTEKMIRKGESEREQHSMCIVLYVYEFMCNPWIYQFFIVKITPGFHLTVGGTGAPSDSIVVPQVQVLVNLTGTQWKPVNLGNLHQDFWSFVDGCWEETVSCPVSLRIAHINIIYIMYRHIIHV